MAVASVPFAQWPAVLDLDENHVNSSPA
jgi:hypothetical protein